MSRLSGYTTAALAVSAACTPSPLHAVERRQLVVPQIHVNSGVLKHSVTSTKVQVEIAAPVEDFVSRTMLANPAEECTTSLISFDGLIQFLEFYTTPISPTRTVTPTSMLTRPIITKALPAADVTTTGTAGVLFDNVSM